MFLNEIINELNTEILQETGVQIDNDYIKFLKKNNLCNNFKILVEQLNKIPDILKIPYKNLSAEQKEETNKLFNELFIKAKKGDADSYNILWHIVHQYGKAAAKNLINKLKDEPAFYRYTDYDDLMNNVVNEPELIDKIINKYDPSYASDKGSTARKYIFNTLKQDMRNYISKIRRKQSKETSNTMIDPEGKEQDVFSQIADTRTKDPGDLKKSPTEKIGKATLSDFGLA